MSQAYGFLVCCCFWAFCVPSSTVVGRAEEKYFRSDHGVVDVRPGSLPESLESAGVLKWHTPVDSGHSTPTVSHGKIFLTTYRPDERTLATVALDSNTGAVLWRQAAPTGQLEQYHRTTGSPAAATPACDGERIYVFFGSCGLLCYNLAGEKIWEYPMGPFQDEFGASSSPVLVGDKVILCEDHDIGSFLLALDRQTGRVLWKVNRPEAVRSYSTPALWQRQGHDELLVAGALELAGYDPSSGEKLWWVDGLARIVIPVPVPNGDMVYMASWTPGGDPGRRLALDEWGTALKKWDRNHDGKLSKSEIDNPEVLDRFYRIDLDQSGDLTQSEWERHAAVFRKAENAALALRLPAQGLGDFTPAATVWKHQRGAPYVATPLVHAGIFWMVKDGGIVTKLNAATGQLLQEERLPAVGNYYASPVVADGKVYFASETGTVTTVAEKPEWQVISSHNLEEKIYATPVIDDGRVYIRTEQAVYCFAKP
jgi:outer membrane protein assembly factor BamB